MILTDQEIQAAYMTADSAELFARAIEQAVITKLAGVSVEPVAEVQTLYYGSEHPPVAFTGVVLSDKTDYYSLPFRENAQLYTASAIAAARVQLIDKVVALLKGIDYCESSTDDGWWGTSYGAAFGKQKLDAIRALIGGAT